MSCAGDAEGFAGKTVPGQKVAKNENKNHGTVKFDDGGGGTGSAESVGQEVKQSNFGSVELVFAGAIWQRINYEQAKKSSNKKRTQKIKHAVAYRRNARRKGQRSRFPKR